MTRDQALRILERYDQGLLSATERAKLTEEVTIALLRQAAKSINGVVTFALSDASFYPELSRIKDDDGQNESYLALATMGFPLALAIQGP